MLITRECDYAVRAVRALAEGGKKSVKEICDSEHIPHQYAYKILKKLEKGGMVQGSRGTSGGYQLVKPLADFTLFDIVMAVEKEIFINECMCENHECPHNSKNNSCTPHHEFFRIQKVLENALSEKTMAEILK